MKIKRNLNAVRIPAFKKVIKVKRSLPDVQEQSTVSKALENVKRILKKETPETTKPVVNLKPTIVRKTKRIRVRKNVINRNKISPKGIVYVGHIPHGFYEEEIKSYFKQFGQVSRVRIARSKKNGCSRGYGYVEFLLPEVAKIAAETMNNYLMCGRLLKATYVPPEEQHLGYFHGRPWSKSMYPKLINRKKTNRLRNAKIVKRVHTSFIQKTVHRLNALEKILEEKGHSIKFSPVGNIKDIKYKNKFDITSSSKQDKTEDMST
ncbi:MKI67 FHA domain-interacting nucleolar phosphoprotein-like [Colletes gigas]|uniref:MKI67 FHA domain-interacting nucleolar phosphoprotein-like n=1 Tax=Colletes gigas TaxID=935657 RepID=UPI001C9AB8E5|nr:MKI67 FHA domain-interacting nucleolar phosphoprotein-like [Colletes gigas]